MNRRALDRILQDEPIGRLIEPEAVGELVGHAYRNDTLAGETFKIVGSKIA